FFCSLFLFSSFPLPPPPISPLFPYTTLFRSVGAVLGDALRLVGELLERAEALRLELLPGEDRRDADRRSLAELHRVARRGFVDRSEEHTSELQSHLNLVCRLLLEKKTTTHSN